MGSSGASIELCSMPGCLCEMPFQHHTSTGTTSVRQVKKEIISALIQKTSTHKGGKARLRAGIHSISVQLCFWLARHRQVPCWSHSPCGNTRSMKRRSSGKWQNPCEQREDQEGRKDHYTVKCRSAQSHTTCELLTNSRSNPMFSPSLMLLTTSWHSWPQQDDS